MAMRDRFTTATKMANTAEALVSRVRNARKDQTDKDISISASAGIDPMLLALATELALKALITFDQGTKVIRTHDLFKLFNMLTPEQRERIESDFQTTYPWYAPSPMDPLGQDVASILEHHADAFVRWRYMHEMTQGSFCLSEIEDVVDTLLRLFRGRFVTVPYPTGSYC